MLGLGVDMIINSYLSSNIVPVMLLTGQSNAEGRGLNSAAAGGETGVRSNVKIWSKSSGSFETLNIGTNNLPANAGEHGIELGVANELANYLDEPLYLIKWGAGSTNMPNHLSAGSVYSDFYVNYVTDGLNALINDGKIPLVFLVFIQGEADTNDPADVTAYSGRFDDWVSLWKGRLGNNLAFIIVEILEIDADDVTINGVFATKAGTESNMAVVDTSTATSSDNIHFDYASLKAIADDVLTETGNLTGLQVTSFNEYTAPTGNLVAYLRFNNSITDETGNFTPTSNGISYDTGIYSGGASESILFNSSTDYVRLPDADSLSFGDGSTDSPFSVSFSFEGSNFGTDVGGNYSKVMAMKDGLVSPTREYYLGTRNNVTQVLQFILYDESTNGTLLVYGSTTLSNSVSYNVCFTYDGSGSASGLKIYLNGVAETLTDASAGTYTAMENQGGDLEIGNWTRVTSGADISYNGKMDNFAIWDKELSATEVEAIANINIAGNELL